MCVCVLSSYEREEDETLRVLGTLDLSIKVRLYSLLHPINGTLLSKNHLGFDKSIFRVLRG